MSEELAMKRNLGYIVAALLVSLLALEPSFAEGSMRCGTHIISPGGRHGPGKYEVLKKCGEPTDREGDTWIYDRPDGKRLLRFDASGNLTRVE